MLPECWAAEVCKGFDPGLIARAMVERKWMEPGDGKNLTKKVRVPGSGTPRLYTISASFLAGEDCSNADSSTVRRPTIF